MNRSGQIRLKCTALVMAAAPVAAMAAGGHHAVDDAALLDAGVCKVEGWLTDARGGGARTLHAGAGCRVGPLELGTALERERASDGSATGYGLQAKWAQDIGQGVSIGLSLASGWQRKAQPAFQGTQVTGLLTWEAGETVRLHANFGRLRAHQGPDETAGGLSADWTFRPDWQVMVERYREDGGRSARAGLRWTPAKGWVVDGSRAWRLRGEGASSWTLALTREFD